MRTRPWVLCILLCSCVPALPQVPVDGSPSSPPAGFVPPFPVTSQPPSDLPFRPVCKLTGAMITGRVTVAGGAAPAGTTVTGKLLDGGPLFANGSGTLAVSCQEGFYAINGAPIGSRVQVTAVAPGFAPKGSVIRVIANSSPDDLCIMPSPAPPLDANRVDVAF